MDNIIGQAVIEIFVYFLGVWLLIWIGGMDLIRKDLVPRRLRKSKRIKPLSSNRRLTKEEACGCGGCTCKKEK